MTYGFHSYCPNANPLTMSKAFKDTKVSEDIVSATIWRKMDTINTEEIPLTLFTKI